MVNVLELGDVLELQHFKQNDLCSDSILPCQLPTTARQVSELNLSCDHPDSPSLLVKLAIDAAPGCGGVAWPAGRSHLHNLHSAQVLANYLLRRKTLHGMTVVELGSGTGLVGVVAGLMHANRVWITDQESLVDLMQTNVSLNGLESNVSVSQLDWGSPLPTSIPPEPDLILAADCVYLEPAFPLLIQTLSTLSTSPRTEILFCYKKRRKADKHFFLLLRKEFTWKAVTDDPRQEDYAREGIFLYRLSKKPAHK